mgnify:CR=1 FL=1
MLRASDGRMWMASNGVAASDDLDAWNVWSWVNSPLPSGFLGNLAEEGDGTIWVASDYGAFSYDGAEWTQHLFGRNFGDNEVIAVDLQSGQTDVIARIPGASGPLLVEPTGDLLYATASAAFPAPPGRLQFPGFVHPAALAVAIDPGGGEVGHPLQGRTGDDLLPRVAQYRIAIIIWGDRRNNVGDTVQRPVGKRRAGIECHPCHITGQGTRRPLGCPDRETALAQQWCLQGLDAGLDQALPPIRRVFFYLPLEHAESMPLQDRCVALYQRLLEDVPAAHRALYTRYVEFAQRHREVIARFGRFPHRNRVLGRETTAEEAGFLLQPGSSF